MKIEELLSNRSDLSTFLVHLTRSHDGTSAKTRLEKILKTRSVNLGDPAGQAAKSLRAKNIDASSQKCVCFTETPLESIKYMLGEIEGRSCQFEPYGIAITKRQGREKGVNPIWYLDMTPGHDWLTEPFNQLIEEAIEAHPTTPFPSSAIAKLSPFVEQMGTWGTTNRKEFSWEREWRSRSRINLAERFLILCPEDEYDHFRALVKTLDPEPSVKIIDPRWSLEQIIARLMGYSLTEIRPL